MDKERKEIEALDALIEHFSAEKFGAVFQGIDEKIIALHQCSSDDFLSLNSSFKENHLLFKEYIKTVYDYLDGLKSLIQNEGLKGLFKEDTAFSTYSINELKSIEESINEVQWIVKKGNSQLSFYNLKQNIESFRLLLANLDLESVSLSKNNQTGKSFFHILSQELEVLTSDIEALKVRAEQINHHMIDELSLLNKVKTLWHSVQKNPNLNDACLHHKIGNIQVNIEKIQKNSLNTSSEIITNLQYHDIIRQKIEHIQAAHKNSISDLFSIEEQIGANDMPTKKSLIASFTKISDIAALQASQLIHANKEYQKAIEVIIAKFNELVQYTESININISELQSQNEDDKNCRIFQFSNLNIAFEYLQSYEKSSKSIERIAGFNNELQKVYASISQNLELLKKKLLKISNFIGNINPGNNSLSIQNVLSTKIEIEKNTDSINNSLNQILSRAKENDKKPDLNHSNSIASKNNFALIIKDSKNLVLKINETQTTLNKIKERIETNTDKATSNIQYYGLFSNVVQEIINELNILNDQLSIGKSHRTSENLKEIENTYTMKSERDVHDRMFTNADKGDEDGKTDDNNIEFF